MKQDIARMDFLKNHIKAITAQLFTVSSQQEGRDLQIELIGARRELLSWSAL